MLTRTQTTTFICEKLVEIKQVKMNNVYLEQLETCISDVSHPSNVQPPK